jgi:hypothetical protein
VIVHRPVTLAGMTRHYGGAPTLSGTGLHVAPMAGQLGPNTRAGRSSAGDSSNAAARCRISRVSEPLGGLGGAAPAPPEL